MFSVGIDLGADPPRWHVTCERCGQELDASAAPLVVFRVKDLDQFAIEDPRVAKRYADGLRAMASGPGPIIVDKSVEVETHGQGMQERLLAHARECAR